MSKQSNLAVDAAKGAVLVGAAGAVFVLGSIGAFLFLIWGAIGAMGALDLDGHIDTFLNHMNGGVRQHVVYRSSTQSSYGSRSSYVAPNLDKEKGNAAKRMTVDGQYFDFSPTGPSSIYATTNNWGPLVQHCLSEAGDIGSTQELDGYIQRFGPGSPLTGEMLSNAARKYGIPVELIAAITRAESSFCAKGMENAIPCRTKNVGNIGNMDDGSTRGFPTWEDGIDAMAKKIARSRVSDSAGGPRILDNTRPETASN